jgi:hypothetical protein
VKLRQLIAASMAWATFASFAAGQNTSNPITSVVPVAPWSIELEKVLQIPNSGGNVARLEHMAFGGAPGTLYVVEQRGRIHQFDPSLANPTPTVFLDVAAAAGNFNFNNEGGLRGLAFHPDFNNSAASGYRKFYTASSRNGFSPLVGTPQPTIFPAPNQLHHDSVVAEWTVDANGAVNTGSYRELMRIGQPFSNHNIGHISFNLTATPGDADYGNLYIALGDGGSSGDPYNMAQDVDLSPASRPYGKMLRINPLVSGANPYSIPADNPFAGQSNRVLETWAYGLRNPHSFDWDTKTGTMYIADIGQGNIEEINIGAAGANYGWDLREGTFTFTSDSVVSPLPANHATDPYTYPVAQYDHDANNVGSRPLTAITSGPVYRGTAIPELTGIYLFAEFATNPDPIYAVDVDDLVQRDDFTNVSSLHGGFLAPFAEIKVNDEGILKGFRQFLRDDNNNQGLQRTDTRFGMGPDGTVYVMNKADGWIRRISGVTGLSQGDANRNGIVDGTDLAEWRTHFGADGDWSDANFDADGIVDGTDFLAWQRNVGAAAPVGAVPEPAAAALMATMVACVAGIDVKRRAARPVARRLA